MADTNRIMKELREIASDVASQVKVTQHGDSLVHMKGTIAGACARSRRGAFAANETIGRARRRILANALVRHQTVASQVRGQRAREVRERLEPDLLGGLGGGDAKRHAGDRSARVGVALRRERHRHLVQRGGGDLALDVHGNVLLVLAREPLRVARAVARVRDTEAVRLRARVVRPKRRTRSFSGALRVSLGSRALRRSAFLRLLLRLARFGGALAPRRGAACPSQLATKHAADAHAAHGVHHLRRGEHDAASA